MYSSRIQLEDSLRKIIYSLLQREIIYGDVIQELETTGKTELVEGDQKFKIHRNILKIHEIGQSKDVDYWRVAVSDNVEVRNSIIGELHSILFAAHPCMQNTIRKVRKPFYWRGMLGDVSEYVETCPTFQMGKTDHTLAKVNLQSLAIPEAKWKEVSIGFITDLPRSKNCEDSIMTVVDRASKMVHLVACRKTITTGQAAKSYWQCIFKLREIPRAINSDRGAQFVGRVWKELWKPLGTKLKYGTAYHPQSQGQVERVNSIVSQTLRCLLSATNNIGNWRKLLATIEIVINSLPHRSTGYSPLYLMYVYHRVFPIELVKGDELIHNETVSTFLVRMQDIWSKAQAQMQRSVAMQQEYYDREHKGVRHAGGYFVLLSTKNLQLKCIEKKLQRTFCGPFKIGVYWESILEVAASR